MAKTQTCGYTLKSEKIDGRKKIKNRGVKYLNFVTMLTFLQNKNCEKTSSTLRRLIKHLSTKNKDAETLLGIGTCLKIFD